MLEIKVITHCAYMGVNLHRSVYILQHLSWREFSLVSEAKIFTGKPVPQYVETVKYVTCTSESHS